MRHVRGLFAPCLFLMLATARICGAAAPKGQMTFRRQDHQALQPMYLFRMMARPDVPWLVPTLTRELSPDESAPTVLNGR